MDESVSIPFICIQWDPELNLEINYIPSENPTYNLVYGNSMQVGLASKRAYSKKGAYSQTSRKAVSLPEPCRYKCIQETSKLAKKASKSVSSKRTVSKTVTPSVSGTKRVAKTRANRHKSSNMKKQAANKAMQPAAYKVKKPATSAKEGGLKKPRRKTFPFLGDFSNQKTIYIQIPTYNSVKINGTQDRLISGQVNSKIAASSKIASMQKPIGYKSQMENTKLPKKASNSLFIKHTVRKTIKPFVRGCKIGAKIKANTVKSPVMKKAAARKCKKPAAVKAKKTVADKSKEAVWKKNLELACTQYGAYSNGSCYPLGDKMESYKKALPFVGDFSNRKTIFVQSGTPTYNPVQTSGTQDRTTFGQVNSNIAASSKTASMQKPTGYKRNQVASKLAKKASNSLSNKHTVGKTTKPSVSGCKKVVKIRSNRVKSPVIK